MYVGCVSEWVPHLPTSAHNNIGTSDERTQQYWHVRRPYVTDIKDTGTTEVQWIHTVVEHSEHGQ